MSKVFEYSRNNYGLASLPSVSQRLKQNSFFINLQNICGECLSELDLLYVFATDGDRDFAKINWVSPGAFTPSESGTVTFPTNGGFNGNGTNSYLNTGYTPSTHGVNYLVNDACAFCYINNDISSNAKSDFGANSGGSDPGILLNARTAVNAHQFRINEPTAINRGSGVSSIGFYQIQKTATVAKLFKNGAQVGSDQTFTATGVPNRFITIFANNNNGTIQSFSNRQMGIFGLGASLSGKESDLYTAWNSYFTSL